MKDFNPEKFQIKFSITEVAVELYGKHGYDFTLSQIAEQTDLTVSEIFDYFPNKKSILEFYYESLMVRYRLMLEEIDDFEEYLLAEKLSNFVFSSFDMIGEKQAFVKQTYHDLILYSFSKTAFEKEIEALLKDFFAKDSRISAGSSILMNDYLYSLLRKKYLKLIHFWLNDDSEEKELTMELTDKYTAFLQELMYTAVLDKGLELFKFVWSNNLISQNIPFVNRFLDTFEIKN